MSFPHSSVSKESACNAGAAGDMCSILGLGRSPGGGHDNPLQYSCLENPRDIGAWWATIHWLSELDMTEETACSTHSVVGQATWRAVGGGLRRGRCSRVR